MLTLEKNPHQDMYIKLIMLRGGAQNKGLQELTSDISKLVNLKTLTLEENGSIEIIPESISCLQKLEDFHISDSSTDIVPTSLAALSSLTSLLIRSPALDDALQLPPSLQVIIFKPTSTLSLVCKECHRKKMLKSCRGEYVSIPLL
jgi:hypothetical protein